MANRWFTGVGSPGPALREDTDLYLDLESGHVFDKQHDTWTLAGTLRAPHSTAPQGWHSGAGSPIRVPRIGAAERYSGDEKELPRGNSSMTLASRVGLEPTTCGLTAPAPTPTDANIRHETPITAGWCTVDRISQRNAVPSSAVVADQYVRAAAHRDIVDRRSNTLGALSMIATGVSQSPADCSSEQRS